MTHKELESEVFKDKHKFQDDVWGQIILNDLEHDVIDTPEFQRLFRTSQLGFVDLVYQTANHTRGVHSIGACRATQLLMKHLADNMACAGSTIKISPAEQILIRLGALLHDISHVPLSHDIEKKTHKIFYNQNKSKDSTLKIKSHYGHYHKHDDCENNPPLYILLCNEDVSTLARVLHHHSASFYELLKSHENANGCKHLKGFIEELFKIENEWDVKRKLLPNLLFHLLIYENHSDHKVWKQKIAKRFDPDGELFRDDWGLGPPSSWEKLHDLWYQPFRHDIIGNTLCADLIDYLQRDPQRLGMNRQIDLHLLSYYVLVPWKPKTEGQDNPSYIKIENSDIKYYCCAIDLQDQKRGTTRVSLINDIFRLLDLRHEIHEKAVMHRVVHSAIAMLSRALLLLGDKKPRLKELIQLEKPNHALQSEDTFFQHLLNICEEKENKELHHIKEAHRILLKLIDRRVYRPLIIIPGDRANAFDFSGWQSNKLGKSESEYLAEKTEYNLRTLATIIDSTYYSPFLLFVSACVEKYLQGVFDTDDDLCDYTQKIFADGNRDNLVKQAMELIPSRIIIWTTPYKQLYKDPAVTVALDEKLSYPIDELVDELAKQNNDSTDKHKSAIVQIKGSINDANSKYSALWKLYVFISDGLYYTGIYNKIKNAIVKKSNPIFDSTQHEMRLNEARNFMVASFETISNHWNFFCTEHHKYGVAERTNLLKTPMDSKNFLELVNAWIRTYEKTNDKSKELMQNTTIDNSSQTMFNNNNTTSTLSTVNIKHYVHSHPLQEEQGRNCRDIRYKMDYNQSDESYSKAKNSTNPREYELVNFLENIGLKDTKVLTELEFKHLQELFDSKTLIIYKNLRSKNHQFGIEDLKLLWLSGFPWPEYEGIKPEKVSGSPRKEELQTERIIQLIPQTSEEIRKWLLNEADILDSRVRRRFTENISQIITLIESLPHELRQEVFSDLKQRFRNESMLIFNDIKLDQIVYALKRKWQKPDDK